MNTEKYYKEAYTVINIYCDESCHLENDGINVMVLGAVWCPTRSLKKINNGIKKIKSKYGVAPWAELKWSKIGAKKIEMYSEIIDFFFENEDLHFRGLIVPDKSVLNHNAFHQTHDDWYYKMYFNMLKNIFHPQEAYNIYLDIKDTHSYEKSQKLHEVCCNSIYDFSAEIIKKIQPIRSDEIQIMQITDILIGALAYRNRRFDEGFEKNAAKLRLIDEISRKSNYSLDRSTLFNEQKVNLFVWRSSYEEV